MLLRRMIENLKSQNWLAVCLDLVIVVVGVFIAFQVERWYDERRLLAEEQEHIRSSLRTLRQTWQASSGSSSGTLR